MGWAHTRDIQNKADIHVINSDSQTKGFVIAYIHHALEIIMSNIDVPGIHIAEKIITHLPSLETSAHSSHIPL